MSLTFTNLKEIPKMLTEREYDQVKESVEELQGKITDINFLSTELDTIYDKTTTLVEHVAEVTKDLIKHVDDISSIHRDIDNTL